MARHSHVPADWPHRVPCRLAFVGEAPSDEEMLAGRPLVGPSGRVFNQMLRTAGLERDDFLVTNVFDTQLPGNDVKAWCAGAKERAAWPAEAELPPVTKGAWLRPEHHHHLERLRRELLEAQPTVIVPLGATALWALTGHSNISATRGSIMAATQLVPGVKLVPTLHPAHVIHEWKMFHVVVSDFLKAWKQSEFPEMRLPKRELWLAPTLDDLRHFKARYLDGADLIAIDIETAWKQITCIGFAPDANRAICVPFVDPRRPNRSYWHTAEQELEAWEWVREVCESPVPKLLQNGPFDIYYLWDRARIKVRNYRHDTRLMHHALYPELPKSLSFMGATYAEQGPWKLLNARNHDKRDD